MRSFKVVRAVALGMSAVALVLALAGAASAAGPRLLLTWRGGPVPGAPYSGENWPYVSFGPNEEGVTCTQLYKGNVNNDKKTLADSLEGPVAGSPFTSCSTAGYSITFGFTKLTLSWNGQIRTHGAALFDKPGPCVYKFSNLAAAFTPGNFVQARETARGYLVGRESNVLTCKYVETMPWFAAVAYPEYFAGPDEILFLNTELRS